MLDRDGASPLETFRCPRWPVEAGDRLDRLPDHRRVYLDYEGPISGGRGEVVRVEAGTFRSDEDRVLDLRHAGGVHRFAITPDGTIAIYR
jgi:hypothetical protein